MPGCRVEENATNKYWVTDRSHGKHRSTVPGSPLHSSIRLPRSFSMTIKAAEAISLYELESTRPGGSGSSFINESLIKISQFPRVFSGKDDSALCELAACYTLLSDKVMPQVSQMAVRSRRDPVQMILFLIETGLECVEPVSGAISYIEKGDEESSPLRFDYKELLSPSAALLEDPLKIYINLKTVEVIKFLDSEGDKQINKSVFINQLLLLLSKVPRVLSSPEEALLIELEEYQRLLSDGLLSLIPKVAARSRRDPLQMFLFLIERGMEQLPND